MAPSGTGPFRITKHVPNQYVEMSRFEGYWNPSRIPRLDSLMVYPIPEATTRLAALRSGQVVWIEVPPPDAIPSLKAAGFQISLWPYPHTYPYVLKCTPDLPFADRRVRQAMSYAIDREGMCRMLNGTAKAAGGFYPEYSPLFGKPQNRYGFDPERAKALLTDAGYGPDRHVKAKIMISTSGSGQMVPIPMNELLQQNFQAVGIDITFDVVEWGAMIVAMRSAPDAPQSHGVDGVNNSLGYADPSTIFRYFCSDALTDQPELGSFQHAGDRRSAAPGHADVRRGAADRTHRPGARAGRRRGAVAVHCARPQYARDVAKGARIPAGAILVAGLYPHYDGEPGLAGSPRRQRLPLRYEGTGIRDTPVARPATIGSPIGFDRTHPATVANFVGKIERHPIADLRTLRQARARTVRRRNLHRAEMHQIVAAHVRDEGI
jgi:hypothetical protein